MTAVLNELRSLASKVGATVRDCGGGHVQIKGALLVNYYPDSRRRTVYIDSTKQGIKNCTPARAVEIAVRGPENGVGKTRRRSNYTKVKRAMFKRAAALGPVICRWCPVELTLETATVDHEFPLSKGGLDHPKNRVLSCGPCNARKADKIPGVDQ